MEQEKNHDLIWAAIAGLGLLAVSFLAFTKKQRDAIVERDENKCQFPAKHNCKGGLHVHHIIPQRYAQEVGILDPDYPENGLSLCENAHNGPDGIHTDMAAARASYHEDPASFSKAFEARDEKLKKKEIYWNSIWDRVMSVVAVRNTQRAEQAGWIFPPPARKRNGNN